MRNIKLTIEYDGTNYAGWQIQGRKKSKKRNQRPKGLPSASEGKPVSSNQKQTIQEIIEKALSQILQERIKVIGSGRTDAGVHALSQVANFKTKSKLNCQNIHRALNSILPAEIRIKQVQDAHPDFHAQFSAKGKLYRYSIVNNSFVSPFQHRYYHLVKYALDIKKMRRASRYLIGKHDFRSFQAVDKKKGNSLRTIKRLSIRNRNNTIELEIEADGFLYRMARNIVGTLLEVGRGRLKPKDIKAILKAKNRIYAGPCAPAKGLCLIQIQYKKTMKNNEKGLTNIQSYGIFDFLMRLQNE